MTFITEADMAQTFLSTLHPDRCNDIFCASEVSGVFGIPDYLFVKAMGSTVKYTIAIELKMRNWRRALIQAFKYRGFVNESYVVLDSSHIKPALLKLDQFKAANVGLVSYSRSEGLFIYYRPQPELPFSDVLATRMVRILAKKHAVPFPVSDKPGHPFTRTIKGRFSLASLVGAKNVRLGQTPLAPWCEARAIH